MEKEISKKLNELYKTEPEEFKKERLKIKSTRNNLLNNYLGLNVQFVLQEKRYNNYEFLKSLKQYNSRYSYYKRKAQIQTAIPKDFLKELTSLDLDHGVDFQNSGTYADLCFYQFYKIAKEKANKEKLYYAHVFVDNLKELESENIKRFFILDIIKRELKIENTNVSAIYKLMSSLIKDDQLSKEMDKKYLQIKKMFTGNPSPTFNYKNAEGKLFSLNKFKGKYVYIDIWATWCGSCLKEVPYLEGIRQKYKGQNIEFISISVDKQ